MLNVGFFSGSRFVKKLIDYLKLNKQDVMGFRSFSSKDKLREYTLEKFSEKNVLDVFLCEDCDEYLRVFDNDESMDAVLSYVIFDNPREGVKNSSRKIKFISKFQSAEEIYVKIIDFLAENSEGIVFKHDNINISSKVSCFYVPGGYFEQDRLFFSLVKSKINNRNDIFVIDLNTFSLSANFLGMNGTRNSNDISQSSISDLIYFIRKKSNNLSLKLESVVKKINDYHYIGPVRDFRELDDVLAEDIKSIIKAIDVRYSPNEILINLGNLSSNLLELFLILDKIYIPGSIDNKDFLMKKEKFVLFLSKEFGEVIVEKLEFI